MQAACAGNGVQLRPQTRVLSRLKALLHQQGPIATNRLLSSQMTRPVSLICVQAVFSQRTVFCRARFARAWAARDFRGRRRQGRMSKSSQARRASALHQRQETATPSSEAGRGRSAIGALPLLLPSAGVKHPSASAAVLMQWAVGGVTVSLSAKVRRSSRCGLNLHAVMVDRGRAPFQLTLQCHAPQQVFVVSVEPHLDRTCQLDFTCEAAASGDSSRVSPRRRLPRCMPKGAHSAGTLRMKRETVHVRVHWPGEYGVHRRGCGRGWQRLPRRTSADALSSGRCAARTGGTKQAEAVDWIGWPQGLGPDPPAWLTNSPCRGRCVDVMLKLRGQTRRAAGAGAPVQVFSRSQPTSPSGICWSPSSSSSVPRTNRDDCQRWWRPAGWELVSEHRSSQARQ